MVVDEDKRSVMARKSNLSSNMENMWMLKILIFGNFEIWIKGVQEK